MWAEEGARAIVTAQRLLEDMERRRAGSEPQGYDEPQTSG